MSEPAVNPWTRLGDWWLTELSDDPSYEEDITPMVLAALAPDAGETMLDVGCGEGRVMAEVTAAGARVVGIDMVQDLLGRARRWGPTARCLLPDLGFLVDGVFDGAYLSLVLEHLADHRTMFRELARVVRVGGRLVMVLNHPIYTAPASAPIQDPDEVLWRPGEYFSIGYTDEPAGDGTVRFHHRPLGVLLTDASRAGWDLDTLDEHGATAGQVARTPALADQLHIPRLLVASWRRRGSSPASGVPTTAT